MVLAGTVAALGTVAGALLPSLRTWHIFNTDTGEDLEGDYEATDLTMNIGAAYARHDSLGRQDPITQYLHGTTDQVSFRGLFRQSHAFDDAHARFETLKEWVRRDGTLRRPPIVLFYVGDGTVSQLSVIDSISANFEQPTVLGAVRGVSFSIALSRYDDFELESGPPPETRYHRASEGEYFELVAAREYGDPLLGDVVRKRMPEKQVVQVGDVLKFPSLEAIRTIKVEPRSVPLQGLTSRKASAQKTLRDFHLDRLNRVATSTVIPEGL